MTSSEGQQAAISYDMMSSAGEEEEIDQSDSAYVQEETDKLEDTDESAADYV